MPDVVGRAYGNRGNARSRQGKMQEALADFQRVHAALSLVRRACAEQVRHFPMNVSSGSVADLKLLHSPSDACQKMPSTLTRCLVDWASALVQVCQGCATKLSLWHELYTLSKWCCIHAKDLACLLAGALCWRPWAALMRLYETTSQFLPSSPTTLQAGTTWAMPLGAWVNGRYAHIFGILHSISHTAISSSALMAQTKSMTVATSAALDWLQNASGLIFRSCSVKPCFPLQLLHQVACG